MAAVLRSSFGKIIRHAFSMEGNFSVRHPQLRRRLLHTGDNVNCTPMTDASHAASSLKSPEVDLLVKKLKNVAVKAILVENTERLVEEQKTRIISPYLRGLAMPAFIAASASGLYMAGYSLGFERKMKEYHSLEQGR